MSEIVKSKVWFKSKTAIASMLTVIAGSLGTFSPDAQAFLSANAATILIALGVLNFILRWATKGRVVLFTD